MDRTSILGDTIEYVKELMNKIQDLESSTKDHLKLVGSLKESNMNESQVTRNPPKVLYLFYNSLLWLHTHTSSSLSYSVN